MKKANNLEHVTSKIPETGRLSLAKLFSDGVLRNGDDLVWKRRSEIHKAKLDSQGMIVTSDGVKHKTPSGAAKHLVGRSVDGWIVWHCVRLDKNLHELRAHN